jgi:sulfofructose kinase
MEKPSKSVRVVGLGQVCVDYVGRVPAYPVEDTKMEMEGFYTSCGGPAATALVTLSRLGVSTSLLSTISDDPFGLQITESLENEGVNRSCLKMVPGYASQFAFIAVTEGDGKRTVFWNRSAVPSLTRNEVRLKDFSGAQILHLDGLMLNASIEAAKQAKALGMTVVMDAGTLREGTLELLSWVDVLIASETFADPIVGSNTPKERTLRELEKLGPREVVITLGGEGSIGLDNGKVVVQEAFSVMPRDTTGAGDVYHGGYIYGLLQGWPMADCMSFASAAAALKCMNGQGWRGIPELKAVKNLMGAKPL